jgi:RimJ/RimL family protein N-acetyltransferase
MNMNFWQGKRICLRGLESADAEYFIRWNLNRNRARHLDFVWPPVSKAFHRAWVAEQAQRKLEQDTFHWVIENQQSEPVGSISTHDCRPRYGTFSNGINNGKAMPAKRFSSY